MIRTLARILTVTLICSRPVSAESVWYQPTPYDVNIITGVQHIWDGWITSVYYGKVLIRDDKLQVGGYGDEYRSYIRFDTTGLPKTVTRAVLNLRPYSRGDDSTPTGAKISVVTGNWTPSMAWNSQPPATFLSNLLAPRIGQWWATTITDTFNGWQSGNNYGLVFSPLSTTNNFNVLRTSRYASDSDRPAILLEFTPPVPTPTFKMPLPGGVSWLVTTEVGGFDCTGKGLQPNTGHTGRNYFSIDFSWRNRDTNGARAYSNPDSGGNIPILAAAGGRIIATSATNPIPDNGNYVVIDHDVNSKSDSGFSTRYLHMRDTPLVSAGQSVRQGDQLGWMGSTGNSTAPHLHFGVRYKDDGASTRDELTYVTVDGWLLKSLQTECSSNGDYIRYFKSSNLGIQLPSISPGGIAEPWTYQPGLSPGGWATLYGTNLADAAASWQTTPGELLPTALAGVTVRVDGTRVPLAFVSPGIVNFLAPGSPPSDNASVTVERNGSISPPVSVPVRRLNPAIYSIADTSLSPAAFFVTAARAGASELVGNPAIDSRALRGARPGESIDLYVTGLGRTSGGFPTDRMFSGAYPVLEPIAIDLNGVTITPEFAGLTSPGLYLVRFTVPQNTVQGNQPIQIKSGEFASAANVFLRIQDSAPPLTLESLTLSSATVIAGQSVTGTITLSGPAPAAGVPVQVSIDSGSPGTITIAPNRNSATFTYTPPANSTPRTVTLFARWNGMEKSAALTITAPPQTSPIQNYEITVNGSAVIEGRRATMKILLSVPDILPRAQVDTFGDFASGIILYAYYFSPVITGDTVTFSTVNGFGSYSNLFGGVTGQTITSGSLTLTVPSAANGTPVSGTVQFRTATKNISTQFSGTVTASTRIN